MTLIIQFDNPAHLACLVVAYFVATIIAFIAGNMAVQQGNAVTGTQYLLWVISFIAAAYAVGALVLRSL